MFSLLKSSFTLRVRESQAAKFDRTITTLCYSGPPCCSGRNMDQDKEEERHDETRTRIFRPENIKRTWRWGIEWPREGGASGKGYVSMIRRASALGHCPLRRPKRLTSLGHEIRRDDGHQIRRFPQRSLHCDVIGTLRRASGPSSSNSRASSTSIFDLAYITLELL